MITAIIVGLAGALVIAQLVNCARFIWRR